MLKNKKGITLVALVITIVILIILATITINFAFGKNGLIEKAQQAKELEEKTTLEEQENLNNITEYMYELIGYDILKQDELEKTIDEIIKNQTQENYVIGIDVYGKLVNMDYWNCSQNSSESSFSLNTVGSEEPVAGYKGPIEENTIVGEIPAYIAKCENGDIVKGPVISMNETFYGLENLTYISDDIVFPETINTYEDAFKLSGLSQIPKNLTIINDVVLNVNGMFEGTKITSIPDNFKLGNSVIDAGSLFSDCLSLTAIPENFKMPNSVEYATKMFYNTKITEIPNGFEFSTNLRKVSNMFEGTSIKKVPDNFTLSNLTILEDASWMFGTCTELITMPEGFALPDNITNIEGMFQGCTKLTSMPNTFIITQNVENCGYLFADDIILGRISDNFSIPENVTNMQKIFRYCNELNGSVTILGAPTEYTDAFCFTSSGISTPFNVKYTSAFATGIEVIKTQILEGKVNFELI